MKHALIVDDSDVIRRVTRGLFASMKFESSEAAGGEAALELVRARMPDVIFVDWHMPLMNGQELIATLRHQPGADKVTIIYCTTENDPIDIARALAAGADDYILKPYDREAVKSKLASVGAVASA